MDEKLSLFGYYLSTMRKNKGISLRELAKALKISHVYLHKIESSQKAPPNDELLLKIVQCLNLNNDECLILLNTAAISKHLYNSKNYYLPADINKYLYANSQAQQLIREADKLNLSSKYWADLIEHLKRL